MKSIITLDSVTKLYGNMAAVDNLSLEVAQGEILGLIGPNGAGKTTTLKMMAGLLKPTSGSVTVMGHDITRENGDIKQHIGYLPEESSLYENLTVKQYLSFFGELYKLPHAQTAERIDVLLDSLKLAEKNTPAGTLSKGMKRKVAIARSLLHDPSVLLMDEPNSGLDPVTSFFVIDYLKKLAENGKTIVLSAHNLFHVEYICDRVAIIKNGKVSICDSVKAIREKLGKREYEVVFKSDDDLDYPKHADTYTCLTSDIREVASMLERISENHWSLVDLSVRQSALEEVYVKVMEDE